MNRNYIERQKKVFQLGVVTPMLSIDHHAIELSNALDQLRESGCEFTHLIVHSPSADALDIRRLFRASETLEERSGTKGIYDALSQGFDYLIIRGITHLTWINTDDLLYIDFMEAAEKARSFPDALIAGRVCWIGEHGEDFGFHAYWPHKAGARLLYEANIVPFCQQGTIFPVSLWEKYGGFEPGYELIADSILWHRFLSKGVDIRFSQGISGAFRIRKGQLSGNQEKSLKEYSRWIGALGNHGWRRKTKTLVVKGLFRVQNLPVYWQRLRGHRKLRSISAMSDGGF